MSHGTPENGVMEYARMKSSSPDLKLGRAASIWLCIAVLAPINGALRELVLVPLLGSQSAHVLSTLLLIGVVFAASCLSIQWIGVKHSGEALCVGFLWMVLTLAFEFLAGHYLFGASWSKLLADYNILQGRVWVLVPLSCLLAPLIALFLKKRVVRR